MEPYQNPFFGGTLQRPTEPGATYRWTEFDRSTPPGNTDLSELAASLERARRLAVRRRDCSHRAAQWLLRLSSTVRSASTHSLSSWFRP